MSINNLETNGEVASQRKGGKIKYLGRKIVNEIKDAFSAPNNEEAWNKFSEEEKKEMLESLEGMDDFDLYSIDISELREFDVTMEGDIVKLKEGAVKKDEIGNYIMINGMKCRELQPGVTGFVYEQNPNGKYSDKAWLEIGFCDKGNFYPDKSVIIDVSGKPRIEKEYSEEYPDYAMPSTIRNLRNKGL